MKPGLAVKLHPTGPWRIGPDSGARNRVDAIYHSDSLYSAITSAMARMGSLEEWLDATARATASRIDHGPPWPHDGPSWRENSDSAANPIAGMADFPRAWPLGLRRWVS